MACCISQPVGSLRPNSHRIQFNQKDVLIRAWTLRRIGRFGHDEINFILKGGNCGWPKVINTGGTKSFIDPVIVWKDATPSSGMTFYKGDLMNQFRENLFVATLRRESLIRIIWDTSGGKVIGIEKWFAQRLRDGRFKRIRRIPKNRKSYFGHAKYNESRIYCLWTIYGQGALRVSGKNVNYYSLISGSIGSHRG